MKKLLCFVINSCIISLVLIGSCLSSVAQQEHNGQLFSIIHRGNTLYVGGHGPGNYTHIQDAIDNASDGDTVYVYDDSSPYLETLVINKSLQLIGENKDTTFLEDSQRAISIYADHVTVSGFTIRNCGDFWNCVGIYLTSDENIIRGNNIANNLRINGLFLDHSSNNLIENNRIENNNFHGIRLEFSSSNIILGNNLSNNLGYGFTFYESSYNLVQGNTIQQSYWTGFYISDNCNNNTIYHNNFKNNPGGNAFDQYNNTWDNGLPSGGNYWDDYTGSDSNHDGIGDTPYLIPGGSNQDHYPLMNPYGENQTTISITITGGWGIHITVKNIGNSTLTNIHWKVQFLGGYLFYPKDRQQEGTIPSLLSNQEVELSTSKFYFGFGKVTVNVTVEEKIVTQNGFLFFFFYHTSTR